MLCPFVFFLFFIALADFCPALVSPRSSWKKPRGWLVNSDEQEICAWRTFVDFFRHFSGDRSHSDETCVEKMKQGGIDIRVDKHATSPHKHLGL